MDITNNNSITQKTTLSPQALLSLNILSLNNVELEQYVDRLFEKNPLIEFTSETTSNTDFSEDYFSRIEDPNARLERDYHLFLRLQLPETHEPLTTVLNILIDDIDNHGRLDFDRQSHPEISDELYLAAKRIIQSLEPAGVGAGSIIECLLLQTARMTIDHSLADMIIENYLNDVGKGQYNHIARSLHVDIRKVESAVQLIRSLEPDPFRNLYASYSENPINPEVIVDFDQTTDAYSITVAKVSGKYIVIDPSQLKFSKKFTDPSVKSYLKSCKNEIDWILNAVNRREATLLRCVEAIIEFQAPFFESTNGELRPLKLESIAERTGLHISTVSRALSNKTLRCTRGVYPLSYFLQHKASTNKNVSVDTIKSLIQSLVSKEDKKDPISDEKLREILKSHGYNLTRRTIANYRKDLGIPNTTVRRK